MFILLKAQMIASPCLVSMPLLEGSACRQNWWLFQERALGVGWQQPEGCAVGREGYQGGREWREKIPQSFTEGRIMARKEAENTRGPEDRFLWLGRKIKKINGKAVLKKNLQIVRESLVGCQRGMDGWGAEGTGKGQGTRSDFERRKLKIMQEEKN